MPCPSKFQEGDYLVTQEQINALGEELVKEEGIVEVDEAHFGPIGLADDSDPNSDALVVLVYNVQDDLLLRLRRGRRTRRATSPRNTSPTPG